MRELILIQRDGFTAPFRTAQDHEADVTCDRSVTVTSQSPSYLLLQCHACHGHWHGQCPQRAPCAVRPRGMTFFPDMSQSFTDTPLFLEVNVGRNLTWKKETEPDFVSAPLPPTGLISPSLSITCSKPLLLSQSRGEGFRFSFWQIDAGRAVVGASCGRLEPFADVQRSAGVPTVRKDRMGEATSRDLEINLYALKWPARRVLPSCSFLPQTHPTALPAAATDVAYPY